MTAPEVDGSLSNSSEDYLEAILQMERIHGAPVRSIEIAGRMGVSRASVSKAMHVLRETGLVDFTRYGQLTLSEDGRRAASEILERHEMLKRFLTEVLGVEESTAETEACRMEHAIGKATKMKWVAYLKKTL
jgi:DtxR family Mn-dependent transcriptional regulator